MISTSFEYMKAQSVDEAINAMGEDAKLLAGGHSLIPALKLRLNQTEKLIDISKLSELKRLELQDGDLIIGAGVTHATIASSELVQQHAPLFAMVAGQIGDIQVRNVGTIGGSIAHADPAADWPAALLGCDAQIKIKGKSGSRTIAAADFFVGIFTTALEEDELITSISVPSRVDNLCSYQKFAQPASRFALVGCAICAQGSKDQLQNVRIAFTGVSDTPYRDRSAEAALEGKSINDVQAAVDALDADVFIMSDHFASETYRKHLAGVMLKRALSAL